MKKMLYSLLVLAMTGAGCSKEPAGSELPAVGAGDHRLESLSATLDSDDPQTRTSLQTSNNNVVYWSTKDRILVVNTTTYESWYYELVSGVGTSVGKFEPLGAAAQCNEDLSNIVAVYPAVAAVVDKAAKTLSFTVNNDWNKTDEGKEKLTACNIRSWNNDSPVAFTHNDIKVSYHVNGTADNANFKFRQLATWCVFSFDFTADETVRKESLQSIEVTTTEADVQISGTRQVDFSDPNKPVLLAKTSELTDADKTVTWTFNSASNMSTAFTRSMILFPGMENRQMKITAQTNMHTFVFYAKPTVKLEAGTVLKFPIGFKQNFNTEIQADDDPLKYAMAYTSLEKELYPFYYYGDANCYLIAGAGKNDCEIDVTRHKASPYYEKNAAEATEATQPTYAKVIWYETAMGAPSINGQGTAAPITGNKFTVTLADATKYGNALIGIYEDQNSDTPLWSYHIWHPEDDPTLPVDPTNYKAMKLYENTYSGAYTVMPMALGATKVVVAEDTDAEKIKGAGLWYQWGRKDPLGRAAAWNNNGTVPVTVLANTLPDENLKAGFANTATFFMHTGDGANNRINLAYEMFDAGYSSNRTATDVEVTEIEKQINGEKIMLSVDRYMLEKTLSNPTMFIYGTSGTFNSAWSVLNNGSLWGNVRGYEYPIMGGTYKSVFDPCPDGYRIALKDLWINFTTNINQTNNSLYYNVKGGGPNGYNKGWNFYYKGMGTVNFDEDGITPIGYTDPVDGLTDFHISAGRRDIGMGQLLNIGNYGYYWCSAPIDANASAYGDIYSGPNLGVLGASGSRYGYSARCVKEN